MQSDLTYGENTYMMKVNDFELARLIKQDELITEHKQVHLLPDGFEPTSDSVILDVACGPGGWLRKVHYEYPTAKVIGIDNNQKVIQYARMHQETKHKKHVSFKVMNIMEPLDFEENTFDVVNARFLTGVVPKDKWVDLLREYLRILKPGGFVCLTESELSLVVGAEASWEACDLMCQSMFEMGRAFSRHAIAISPMLRVFLQQAGFAHIDLKMIMLDWSADQPLHAPVAEDMRMALQALRTPILKIQKMDETAFEQLCKRVDEELRQERFYAYWPLVSAQARKPE